IPWPLFCVSTGPESITTQAVGEFILLPYHSRDKSRKERLCNAMLRWQPDKFEERLMLRIKEAERPRVREAVGAEAFSLIELTTNPAVSAHCIGIESPVMCNPTSGDIHK
ncbi:hypothetical protein B0J17DRAFT_582691, partial [Rhizoctonia solani]